MGITGGEAGARFRNLLCAIGIHKWEVRYEQGTTIVRHYQRCENPTCKYRTWTLTEVNKR